MGPQSSTHRALGFEHRSLAQQNHLADSFVTWRRVTRHGDVAFCPPSGRSAALRTLVLGWNRLQGPRGLNSSRGRPCMMLMILKWQPMRTTLHCPLNDRRGAWLERRTPGDDDRSSRTYRRPLGVTQKQLSTTAPQRHLTLTGRRQPPPVGTIPQHKHSTSPWLRSRRALTSSVCPTTTV